MKKLKKILALALVAVSLMAVALPAGAAIMYTNATQVAVRNSPNAGISNVHTRLAKGSVVDASYYGTANGNSWHSTGDFGGTKYIVSGFLQTTKP